MRLLSRRAAVLDAPEARARGACDDAPLEEGSTAVIGGLQKRPELNGTRCRLLALDAASGRWHAVTQRGEHLKLKPDNLRHAYADEAESLNEAG